MRKYIRIGVDIARIAFKSTRWRAKIVPPLIAKNATKLTAVDHHGA
jgi:hypothetical protein